MKTRTVAALLAFAAGFSGQAFAGAQPHMIGHNVLTLADGSRIELTTSFRAEVLPATASTDSAPTTLNEATVEVEIAPGNPDVSGLPPDPIRLRVTGEFLGGQGSIDPCWMPALFLLATGQVTADQVQEALGFSGTITHLRGFSQPPSPATILRVLGLLVAQANALRPERASAIARLVEIAFPPSEFPPGPCLPETNLRGTAP